MKDNSLWKIWNVIYPILIYFMVSNVVIYLLVLVLGIPGMENREAQYTSQYMMLQTIAAAVSIPILYGFYQQDGMCFTVFRQRTAHVFLESNTRQRIRNGVLMFIGGALAGIVLNNIISATGLLQQSAVYQEVTSRFYGGGVFFEILGAGILIPFTEELLYRGLVYGRLTDWIGVKWAVMMSSIIFGALHLNIVQFIYALLLGIMLAWFLEKTGHLYGAVAGHIGANLLTIIRIETGILDWMGKSSLVFWGSTILLLLLCLVIFYLIKKE